MEGISLKDLRIQKGLTLQNLAELSGINISRLSIIERGLESPNKITRIRLENALGGQRINFVDAAEKKIRTLYPIMQRMK